MTASESERDALLAEAAALRERAREARTIAQQVRDDFISTILTKRAEDCEREAEALEAKAAER